MRDLRRQNKTEPKSTEAVKVKIHKEVISKCLEKKVRAKHEIYLSQVDILAVQADYEKKLKTLEEENKRLKSINTSLSKNEDKFLNAIRSEAIVQNTDWPIISTNRLRKVYKVHPAYFSKSLNSLRDLGMIERKQASFSGKIITYRYKILL